MAVKTGAETGMIWANLVNMTAPDAPDISSHDIDFAG